MREAASRLLKNSAPPYFSGAVELRISQGVIQKSPRSYRRAEGSPLRTVSSREILREGLDFSRAVQSFNPNLASVPAGCFGHKLVVWPRSAVEFCCDDSCCDSFCVRSLVW